MLETSLSAVLGLIYIVVGAVTVWLIFHASSRLKDKGASAKLVQGHRIGGYIFILLFCVMTYYMVMKIKDTPDELALRPLLHMLLAMLLIPILFIKVLVARYYKTYYSVLMPLGLIIFSLSFVIVMMAVGPYFLRKATIKDVALESINLGTNKIDIDAARILTEKKCSKCHGLDRVVGVQKDAKGWLASVNRMRALPSSGIIESDVPTIVSYLVSQTTVVDDKGQMTAEGLKNAGKGLVDTRCNKCHDLDRTYGAKKSADEWRSTVVRMVAYSGNNGLFKTGDDEAIIKFLAETQNPDAAEKRTEMVAKASSSGTSLLGSEVKAPVIPKPLSPLNASAIILVLGGVIIFGVMMLRRPGNLPLGIALASAATIPKEDISITPSVKSSVKLPQPFAPDPKKSALVLQLARIETQTPNAKTLRFLLPQGEQFSSRPGQFLTFQWMIDGKKAVRSYTICSSPTQQSYIEITPKKVDSGYVSTFLNEKATLGLTVEAKGPSGQFYFDENKHRKLVLLAAGSGITPMISILRYLDDRCLSTEAILIYNVQTSKDIIFEKELNRLKENLPNFRYVVSLTKPDKEWRGSTGRISQALIENNLKDLNSFTFFICGPRQFMDSLTETLKSMGVAEAQIKVESFGGRPLVESSSVSSTGTKPIESATATEKVERPAVTKPLIISDNNVEFVRSRKQCLVPPEKTLLEVAEINGVTIPFSCRQGQCGTCTTRLLEGDVTMEVENGLDPELKEEGYILTCVGYAKGKVKLDA
ncbi:MAG: photosystem P840 reaction-center cytochrome c-551 [Acidobacteria bacterium]|nr:photosystem P840 reaction-center cytochrome c-551 [Acidobacteriota bacterium]